jgi:hypothetical protein
MNRDDAVVVRKFYNLEEANLAASVLRDNGLECEVLPDDAGGAYPMLHLTTGIRVIVERIAEEAARGLLDGMTDISDEELNRQAEAAGEESEGEEPS